MTPQVGAWAAWRGENDELLTAQVVTVRDDGRCVLRGKDGDEYELEPSDSIPVAVVRQ